jgi:hypothetical protein
LGEYYIVKDFRDGLWGWTIETTVGFLPEL